MAIQVWRKDFSQISACRFIRHPCETRDIPGLAVALDDERARVLVKLVRVRGEGAGRGFAKGQGEPMKQLMGAVPDILVRANAQIRFEVLGKRLPHAAVNSVRTDDQI